ncbi:ergosterol biosynthesis ERG4/ERG24 family-domain-containing protein [Aspergillus leporis]|uniref:7-dehydrocholesterol reductase n=1 Tax=Aspergillus leporis TaxID=41062 RepID=A0A5N5WLD5_9EURO|nr:ergosterol biosynthesis ERG4/ERG24 family-domain-containing protein [Aspergillus leporis]
MAATCLEPKDAITKVKSLLWGRRQKVSVFASLPSMMLITAAPLVVLCLFSALTQYDGSVAMTLRVLQAHGMLPFLRRCFPGLTTWSGIAYIGWVAFQAFLYHVLPGRIATDPPTPGGHSLPYRINGLWSWITTLTVFLLLVAANIYGLLITTVCTAKCYVSLQNTKDRPSFAAFQHQKFGYVTNSMMVVIALHALYVVDFFVNEEWQVWYLAHYLAYHPVQLPWRLDHRLLLDSWGQDCRSRGQCLIWGRKPRILLVTYKTVANSTHLSMLLRSGWWGIVRHPNYVGDLIFSFSTCAGCGFSPILPWSYFFFMASLLIHRCLQDEARCSEKYGESWRMYCATVR